MFEGRYVWLLRIVYTDCAAWHHLVVHKIVSEWLKVHILAKLMARASMSGWHSFMISLLGVHE